MVPQENYSRKYGNSRYVLCQAATVIYWKRAARKLPELPCQTRFHQKYLEANKHFEDTALLREKYPSDFTGLYLCELVVGFGRVRIRNLLVIEVYRRSLHSVYYFSYRSEHYLRILLNVASTLALSQEAQSFRHKIDHYTSVAASGVDVCGSFHEAVHRPARLVFFSFRALR